MYHQKCKVFVWRCFHTVLLCRCVSLRLKTRHEDRDSCCVGAIGQLAPMCFHQEQQLFSLPASLHFIGALKWERSRLVRRVRDLKYSGVLYDELFVFKYFNCRTGEALEVAWGGATGLWPHVPFARRRPPTPSRVRTNSHRIAERRAGRCPAPLSVASSPSTYQNAMQRGAADLQLRLLTCPLMCSQYSIVQYTPTHTNGIGRATGRRRRLPRRQYHWIGHVVSEGVYDCLFRFGFIMSAWHEGLTFERIMKYVTRNVELRAERNGKTDFSRLSGARRQCRSSSRCVGREALLVRVLHALTPLAISLKK